MVALSGITVNMLLSETDDEILSGIGFALLTTIVSLAESNRYTEPKFTLEGIGLNAMMEVLFFKIQPAGSSCTDVGLCATVTVKNCVWVLLNNVIVVSHPDAEKSKSMGIVK